MARGSGIARLIDVVRKDEHIQAHQTPDLMDSQQVAHFIGTYSRMSDEELAFLLVTRGEGLSDEARHALQTVIGTRDPAAFRRELSATQADVSAQIRHASQEAEKHQAGKRQFRLGVRLLLAGLIGLGLLGALVGEPERWLTVAGIALVLWVLMELRFLLGRFITAVFRMH